MAANMDFCTELKEKTKNRHDKSDKLINLKVVVALTDTRLWAGVLTDFYVVYRAIEEAMAAHKDHPCVGPLIFEGLLRSPAFEKDLQFYLGSDWRKCIQPSEAARLYSDRIWEVADTDPSLLVAYANNMYQALMAGGQIIKRVVQRTLGLPGSEGVAIFEFEDGYIRRIRPTFKENINKMSLTREEKDKIIAEQIRSFQMNDAIASNVKPKLSSFKRLAKLLIIILFLIVLTVWLIRFVAK